MAIECFNKSIQINSKFAHAYHNLGNVYTTLGNFSEAKKNFSNAIEIEPLYTNSWRTLGRLVKYKKDDINLNNVRNLKLLKPGTSIKKGDILFKKIDSD